MEKALYQIAYGCDYIRGSFLRVAMRSRALRFIFMNRAVRLFLMFHLSVLVFLPLSLFYPLIVLSFAPLIYGIPHIATSFYYSSRSLGAGTIWRKYFLLGMTLWVLVSAYRVLTDFRIITNDINRLEIMIFFSMLGIAAFIEKREENISYLRFSLISIFFGVLWMFPLETLGISLLVHNWVAFYFWGRLAKTKADLITVLACLVTFALLHGLVMFGAFEFVYSSFKMQDVYAWGTWSVLEIAQLLAPWDTSVELGSRMVILYALGQSLHYFVWLKAIPDTHLARQTSPSFRMDLVRIKSILGRPVLRMVILSTASLLIGILFLGLKEVRILYFAISAAHGFIEFAFFVMKPQAEDNVRVSRDPVNLFSKSG